MDRRTAIKQLSLLGGAMLLAPSCTFSSERVSVALDNLKITPSQESLLGDIVETLIPATDIPGAKELKLHHFVLVMVDGCRGPSDREAFQRGLGQIDALAEEEVGTAFSDCDAKQKEVFLTGLMDGTSAEPAYEDARAFLGMTKGYTIQGFLQSEYVMTEVNPYQLVPGHFDGCVTS
ncbi:gluconate 2-dehydrogenase subunit 3 family protein [Balneolaceae bacterium YR4-1]|uniref:Gluconate 2-dehydrogenase subunit 3 family protein n=1 Tax=Halalkalibaculum roseum TaxID=2709311 RepID=A0A6M1SQN1_9BACT|nr:gluconate 2-dehydrogenase subunit 3 family protein [Halalkalibaculum roseum]NGP75012.1 gluconate 2-dehydrogenase subunit 3 family protein [Halalkalibaculum roseum]